MSTIYLFPGQGSQKKGMGAELFGRFPDLVRQADEILGYSVQELCLEDPHEQLGDTLYTQPALYTVNALAGLARLADGEPKPDFTAGHSLGEYNALLAAGVYDFAAGLELVKKRGELMSQASGGGMAAVIGLEADAIRQALAAGGFDGIDVANYNSPNQTVISGMKTDIEAAAPKLDEAGAKRVIVLNVSGPFHSRYMEPIAAEFAKFLAGVSFNSPAIPVIANCTARPYTGDNIVANLTGQICNSVLWVDSIRWLQQQPAPEFFEVGPGKVLTGLLRYLK